MQLPVGVYVVSSAFQGKDGGVSFIFKGVEYDAQMGKNAFYRMEDLIEQELAMPQEPFCGYGDTPIILFPAGVYEAGTQWSDKPRAYRFCYHLPCAVTILGENAGVSPNGEDLRTSNPQWGEESVFLGSYYFGALGMEGERSGAFTIDGMVLQTTRICDDRTAGETVELHIKNCVFRDFYAYDLVTMEPMDRPDVTRKTYISNVRCDSIDALEGESRLCALEAGDLTVEKVYFANTDKFTGLTDYLNKKTCGRVGEKSTIIYKDSIFENCTAPCGMGFCMPADSAITLKIENCEFHNMAPKGVSPLQVELATENCALELKNCTFSGEDTVPAVLVSGNQKAQVAYENVAAKGYGDMVAWKKPRRTQPLGEGEIPLDDPHKAVAADFAVLDKIYENCRAYHGDFHTHTNSGGTSDGKTPLGEFTQQLKALDMDFAAVVDHRQMRHFFLPEWDESMLVCGSEPSITFPDRQPCANALHYCMTFPDKEGLGKVLAAYPQFEYTGGTDGHFRCPQFTTEEFAQLGEFIYDMGGLMTHAHPKQVMISSNPLDYYFGDKIAIETVHGAVSGYETRMNRDLWVSLLQLGKRVRTYGSTDTHAAARNDGQTTLYAKNRHSKDFFNAVRAGNCTAGAVGIQMAIDDTPMGGQVAYQQGQILRLRVADFHSTWKEDAVYRLNICTEKGTAYAVEFAGKQEISLAISVAKRAFYRAEIWNESDGHVAALGNPIWLD